MRIAGPAQLLAINDLEQPDVCAASADGEQEAVGPSAVRWAWEPPCAAGILGRLARVLADAGVPDRLHFDCGERASGEWGDTDKTIN